MTDQPPPVTFEQRLARLADLAEQVEHAGDHALAEATRRLTAALLDLHADGLRRLLEALTESGEAGRAAVARAAEDPRVCGLLLLHGLHPDPLHKRVEAALAKLRRQLRLDEAHLRLIEVADGHARIALAPAGCHSTVAALRSSVEAALLAAAPDAAGLHIEDLTAPADPPLVQLQIPAAKQIV